MAKNDRFQVIHSEGNGLTGPQLTVLMDTATGVQYLLAQSGSAGGLCGQNCRRPVRGPERRPPLLCTAAY